MDICGIFPLTRVICINSWPGLEMTVCRCVEKLDYIGGGASSVDRDSRFEPKHAWVMMLRCLRFYASAGFGS
jgi:hypothetical protein